MYHGRHFGARAAPGGLIALPIPPVRSFAGLIEDIYKKHQNQWQTVNTIPPEAIDQYFKKFGYKTIQELRNKALKIRQKGNQPYANWLEAMADQLAARQSQETLTPGVSPGTAVDQTLFPASTFSQLLNQSTSLISPLTGQPSNVSGIKSGINPLYLIAAGLTVVAGGWWILRKRK